MPLCKLEIPTGYPLNKTEAETRLGYALDQTLGGLNIPDPEDREMSIVRVGDGEPRIVISYTVGPEEYPGSDPESFDPSKETVRKVGAQIHQEASESLGVAQTRMEAWRDTTFVMTPSDIKHAKLLSEELKAELSSKVKGPKVTLYLSPEMRQGTSSPKETETKMGNPLEETVREVSASIGETLGLPEVKSKVVWTELADSDVSVEFDCQVEGGYRIPSDVREAAAKSVEDALNKNLHTRDREAEIWIRQDGPEVETFT